MIESVSFPVGDCPSCKREVLLAGALDEDQELVYVCSHCGCTIPADQPPRQLGARSLALRGYLVEGELDDGGSVTRSSSGCSTCSK
jgi:hypothetical protein